MRLARRDHSKHGAIPIAWRRAMLVLRSLLRARHDTLITTKSIMLFLQKKFTQRFTMPVIVIANPKGGVGKSTFATNLAGYFTFQGCNVMLGDIDVQQSSR